MGGYFDNYPLPLFFEVMAAVVAIISLIRFPKEKSKNLYYFTAYLWLTVIVENLGLYPIFLCGNGYDEITFFSSNPHLVDNFWLYNIYTVIAYSFLSFIFFKQFASAQLLKKIKIALFLFIIFGLVYMHLEGIFLRSYSKLVVISGLCIYLFSISHYYYHLLISDKILSISKSLPFIVSICTLLFFLSITPLFISSEFIRLSESVFTTYYRIIFTYSNYFLYGMFIFGFLRCYWFNKSLKTKSSSLSIS